jgi:hypothetical protein
MQLQTEVQLITKEVDAVRNSTDTELTTCVQNFDSERKKINEHSNDYKSHTDT